MATNFIAFPSRERESDNDAPATRDPFDTQYSHGNVVAIEPARNEQITLSDGMQWMSIQDPISCLTGLTCLSAVDQLVIRQKKELLEAIIGFEKKNKYEIKNSSGEFMFFALEESDGWSRQCCGSDRSFDMKILDGAGNEVIHLFRPLVCNCFTCTMQSLDVSCPPGTPIGTVMQECTFFTNQFGVLNTQGQTLLRIEQPFCTCSSRTFQIMSADGSRQVGKISKKWGGLSTEMFTDADTFGVSFPANADVKTKALLLGAVFLIDFLFFES